MLRIGVASKFAKIRPSLQSNEQLNDYAAEEIQSIDAILPLQHASPDVPEQERECQLQAAYDEQIDVLSSPTEMDSSNAEKNSHSSLVSIQILS